MTTMGEGARAVKVLQCDWVECAAYRRIVGWRLLGLAALGLLGPTTAAAQEDLPGVELGLVYTSSYQPALGDPAFRR